MLSDYFFNKSTCRLKFCPLSYFKNQSVTSPYFWDKFVSLCILLLLFLKVCIIFQIVWVLKPSVSEIYFLKCRFSPMIYKYKYTSKHSVLFLLCPHPTYRNRKWKWISPFGWKDRWISSQSNKNPLYWQPWKNHYLPWSSKHLPALWWNCGMLLFTIKSFRSFS